jgi:hypothetical protein
MGVKVIRRVMQERCEACYSVFKSGLPYQAKSLVQVTLFKDLIDIGRSDEAVDIVTVGFVIQAAVVYLIFVSNLLD